MLVEKAVLIYALPGEKRAHIGDLGAPVIFVPEEKNGLTVLEVLSLSRAAAPAKLSEPMAVFHGLSGRELDYALAAIGASGAGITLRAVTTPVNLGWTGPRLQKDLAAERNALKKRGGSIHRR